MHKRLQAAITFDNVDAWTTKQLRRAASVRHLSTRHCLNKAAVVQVVRQALMADHLLTARATDTAGAGASAGTGDVRLLPRLLMAIADFLPLGHVAHMAATCRYWCRALSLSCERAASATAVTRTASERYLARRRDLVLDRRAEPALLKQLARGTGALQSLRVTHACAKSLTYASLCALCSANAGTLQSVEIGGRVDLDRVWCVLFASPSLRRLRAERRRDSLRCHRRLCRQYRSDRVVDRPGTERLRLPRHARPAAAARTRQVARGRSRSRARASGQCQPLCSRARGARHDAEQGRCAPRKAEACDAGLYVAGVVVASGAVRCEQYFATCPPCVQVTIVAHAKEKSGG